MNEEQGGTQNPYNPNNGIYSNDGTYPSGSGYATGGYQNMGGYQNATGYTNAGGYQNVGGYQNMGYGYGNSGWQNNQPIYSSEPIMLAPDTPGPNKKKRIGLVVGLIAVVLLLVGVLALVTMLPSDNSSKDPVSAAISKLLSENAPEGVAIDGKANLSSSDNKAFVQSAELKVKSELMTGSLINSTVVGLNARLSTGGDIALKLSENYGGEGDIFIKIDGVKVSLQNQAVAADKDKTSNTRADDDEDAKEIEVSEEYLKCLSDINSGDNCKDLLDDETTEANNLANLTTLTTLLQALSSMDGEWIRIPTSDLTTSTTTGSESGDDMGRCVVGLVENVRDNRESLAQLYDNNPFIYSKMVDQDDSELSDLDRQAVSALLEGTSEENDEEDDDYTEEADDEGMAEGEAIYQVMFDEETLKNFVVAIAESGALDDSAKCLGGGGAEVNAEQATEIVKNLPSIFVTLDDTLNFTKVYFAFTMDARSNVVVGMDLSYPENITVTKPGNYKDLSAVMQNLSGNLGN